MKQEATFEELGKIFSTIAKAEKNVAAYKQASQDYEKASDEYDKSDAYDAEQKARKAIKKVFSELICLLDIDGGYTGGLEGYIVELSKRLYEPQSFLIAIKEQALRLAKSIAY